MICDTCENYGDQKYCKVKNSFIIKCQECSKYKEKEQKCVSLFGGGCVSWNHGVDLYNRINVHLKDIINNKSEYKTVKVIFHLGQKPSILFFHTLIECLFKAYKQEEIDKKIIIKGLSEEMIKEVMKIKKYTLEKLVGN